MKTLVDLAYKPRAQWATDARAAFSKALRDRYLRVQDLTEKRNDEKRFQLRVNDSLTEGSVPYAALLAPDQDTSGGYGGMSFVMFPPDENGSPALIAMGVGTTGLAPDEMILGRPGHARKCSAIAAWINQASIGEAWAKRDPVRIDIDLPRSIHQQLSRWDNACKKYGKVLYTTFVLPNERTKDGDNLVARAITAFIDLFFSERQIDPKVESRKEAEEIRQEWMRFVMPAATEEDVLRLLDSRRFVILEGPPGTGKTELATRILALHYRGRGRVIQFHPGTTYESFVGGLAPTHGGALGFTFEPTAGHLMMAVQEASERPNDPYLLVIDEINRADLSKVLGEAIYLFEPGSPTRSVTLAHQFNALANGNELRLPENLRVLGTMNSADRSIAILDIAVRRRFAFVALWPQLSVLDQLAGKKLRSAFEDLALIFIEHAGDDALSLMPGHAYFLGSDREASARLQTSVKPLLEEYLAQGYVAGFADEIRAYLDRISQAA